MIRRRYVSVEDRNVHYLRGGSGPPVVLLHSAMSSSEAFRPLIDRLSGRFTWFAFDVPGFGYSEPLDADGLEVSDLADALIGAMVEIGIPPCPVFGTHTGAAVALEMGVRHPDRVTGLVLDGVPIFRGAELDHFDEAYFAPLEIDGFGGTYARTWTRFRDQSTWFPWTAKDPSELARYDLPSADVIHRSMTEFLVNAAGYAAPYHAAVWYCERGVEATALLESRAVFTARSSDVLFPHLDRLPPLKPQQAIRRLGPGMDEVEALTVECFDAWPAATPAPPDRSRLVPHGEISQGFVDLPDRQVFVRAAGSADKPPLLLLHDAPGSGLSLEPLIAALGRHFRVCAPDLPGSGETPGLPGGASLGDIAGTIAETVRLLGFGPAAVYGMGVGASLAIELAAREPGSVSTLVLSGVPLPDAAERAELQAHVAPPIEIADNGSHWYDVWLMLRDSLVWFPWYDRRLPNQRGIAGDFGADRLHAWTLEVLKQAGSYAQLIDAALAEDTGARLAAVRVPIAVCRDPRIPFSEFGDRLTALVPDAPVIDAADDPVEHASRLSRLLR